MWRYTKDQKLENKSGPWKYGNKLWSIPKDGEHAKAGFIKDQETKMVLGVAGANADEDAGVDLQNPNQEDPFCQKWRRSKPNNDGWFSFLNPATNEFLTVATAEEIVVSGMCYQNLLYNIL